MAEVRDRRQQDATAYHDLVDLVQEALGIAYVFEHVGGQYDIVVPTNRRWYAVIQISLHELGDPSSYTRSFDDVDTRHPMPVAARQIGDVPACATEVEYP